MEERSPEAAGLLPVNSPVPIGTGVSRTLAATAGTLARSPSPQPTERGAPWSAMYAGPSQPSCARWTLERGARHRDVVSCRRVLSLGENGLHRKVPTRRGPACQEHTGKVGSKQKKHECLSSGTLPQHPVSSAPTHLGGRSWPAGHTPPSGWEVSYLIRNYWSTSEENSKCPADPDSSSFCLGFMNEIKCTQLLPLGGPTHPSPPKLQGEPRTLGPTP